MDKQSLMSAAINKYLGIQPTNNLPPITPPAASQGDNNQGDGKWSDFRRTARMVGKTQEFPVSVLLGQAANESARGQSAPGNNYFGIKGQGNAGTQNLATQEYGSSGYYGENSNFASYSDAVSSMIGYVNLIKNNPLYAPAYQQWRQDHNDLKLLQGIKAAGYATSPTYVQDISSTPEFQQYAGGSQ